MTLEPRSPLLGNWNCTWFLAHNVPTTNILKQSSSGSTYRFEHPVAHLLTQTPSDKYELRVALPEGASVTKISLQGVEASAQSTTSSFSYLDFIGRPTLVFEFEDYLPDLTPEAKLSIEYSFQSHLIWIEPLYLVAGLLGAFAIYIGLSKMDLSFGSQELVEKRKAKAK